MRAFKLFPLAAVLLAGAPAQAQSGDPVYDDTKCLVASGSEDPSASQEDKDALLTLGVFFMGKLYGRNPSFDIEKYINSKGGALDQIDTAKELLRCSDELGKRGAALAKMGQ